MIRQPILILLVLVPVLIFHSSFDSLSGCCAAMENRTEDDAADPEKIDADKAAPSSAVKTAINRDFMLALPNSDSIITAFSLAPGVTGSGNIRVHGGALNDNLYLVDGIDTTDPLTSTYGPLPYADTVDTIEILTGAFPAEYGRFMGGIIKTETQSGTNDFHGIMRYKILNSITRSSDDWSKYRMLADYNYRDYAVTINGPFIRDKLWFMVSYNYYNEDGSDRCGSSYWADPASRLKTVKTDRVHSFPSLRLTIEPNQEHRIVCIWSLDSYIHYNYNSTESFSFYGENADTLSTKENFADYFGITWNWTVNPDLSLTAGLGGSHGAMDDKPTSENNTDPAFFDTYSYQYYNNARSWTEEDRTRMQCDITADYCSDTRVGFHHWKSGIEYQWIESEKMFRIPGGVFYTITQVPVGDWDDPEYFTGMYATRATQLFPGSVSASGEYTAFFIQDDWSVTDRVTLNLGIRLENMVYQNDAGKSDIPAWKWGNFTSGSYMGPDLYNSDEVNFKNYAPMEFDRMIAPRAGMVWDVFGTGKSSIHAFWGRYFNPFDFSLPDRFQPFGSDPFAVKIQEYLGPAWTDRNKDGIPDEDYFYEYANWETGYEPEPEPCNMIDPDLKPEYTDEFSVGYRQDIMPDVSVGIVYTSRTTRDMIEDVGLFTDDDGNVTWTWRGGIRDDFSDLDPGKQYDPRDTGRDYAHFLYWITNVPGNRRDYQGIEINAVVNKPDWNLMAGYTLSKVDGCVTEDQPGYSGISQFSGLYDTWQTSRNLYGELPWSCRHYLKLAGSYRLALTDWYELSFGVNGFWRSGYFYSKRTTPDCTYDPDNADNDINDPDTWTGRPPYRSYAWTYPEGRGGYVLPDFYTIDVSIQNTFRFGRLGAATLILDVENITDNQDMISAAETANPLFGEQDGWGSPRVYRLSLTYNF